MARALAALFVLCTCPVSGISIIPTGGAAEYLDLLSGEPQVSAVLDRATSAKRNLDAILVVP
jgi:hypothetical protein